MFSVQLVQETIKLTNAKYWDEETTINLERSLLPSTRIGGHFVQGHVDGTVEIKKIISYKDSALWQFSIPKNLHQYIVHKGSICLDGISLTIAEKTETYFAVALIPHTLNVTNWHSKKVGDIVNVEVDIMAKYIKVSWEVIVKLSSIESVLEDVKVGKPIIVIDNEDRENEGDLFVASELINPKSINFMAKEGRGLICVSMELVKGQMN